MGECNRDFVVVVLILAVVVIVVVCCCTVPVLLTTCLARMLAHCDMGSSAVMLVVVLDLCSNVVGCCTSCSSYSCLLSVPVLLQCDHNMVK